MIPYPAKIALDGTQGKKKWCPMVLPVPMAKSEFDLSVTNKARLGTKKSISSAKLLLSHERARAISWTVPFS